VGGSMQQPTPWSPPGGQGWGIPGNFWVVFAVFFPAATGIMAGANMSGDLKDPRKSIPVGTLSAIALSLVIYLVLAYWLARSATIEQLQNNYTVLIDKSAWAPVVLAGLLGATFSSAMGSIVGSPRILQALATHRITPMGAWLEKRTKGEPRHALFVSAAIIVAALMLRDLNAIAPLITMFFLVTYAMINTVVFLEQHMGLVSFRPLFSIPRWVAPLGIIGCIAAMFIVNPPFGLVAVVVVLGFYAFLVRRHLQAPFGDVRSGLFVSVSEWAAKKASRLPQGGSRGWRPNLLTPVTDPARLRGDFRLLHSLAAPRGSVHVLGVCGGDADDRQFARPIKWLASAFRDEGVFASSAVVSDDDLARATITAARTLEGAFFRPNVIFLPVNDDMSLDETRGRIGHYATHRRSVGLMLYAEHAQAALGRQAAVNLHVVRPADGWQIRQELGSLDLAALAAWKVQENWSATLRLIAWVDSEQQKDAAREYLQQLIELGRLEGAQPVVRVEPGGPAAGKAPPADLHCLAADRVDLGLVRQLRDRLGASVLVIASPGSASVLA
ncbi:MAG: amino acid permease, partial [Planctomycetota bacterium]